MGILVDVKHQPSVIDTKLAEVFDGDKELAIFWAVWLKCGQNAGRAYQKLHPKVTAGSARVLGSRLLTRVNISDVLALYGLGIEEYMMLLKAGINATKEVKTRQGTFTVPDNDTRFKYFQVWGKLLGFDKPIEQKQPMIIQLVKYGSDSDDDNGDDHTRSIG